MPKVDVCDGGKGGGWAKGVNRDLEGRTEADSTPRKAVLFFQPVECWEMQSPSSQPLSYWKSQGGD